MLAMLISKWNSAHSPWQDLKTEIQDLDESVSAAILQEIGVKDVGTPSQAETLAATTEELEAAAAGTPVGPALGSMTSFETLPYTPNRRQQRIDLDLESPGSDVLVRYEPETPAVPEAPQHITPDVARTPVSTESMQPPDRDSVTSDHGGQAKKMCLR